VGLGVCNLDLIYPVACRLALSEVNGPAIVFDESCRIFPRAPGEQEVDVAWIKTWKQRKPLPRHEAKRTALKSTNGRPRSENGANVELVARSTAMPYQNLARIESGFVDLH